MHRIAVRLGALTADSTKVGDSVSVVQRHYVNATAGPSRAGASRRCIHASPVRRAGLSEQERAAEKATANTNDAATTTTTTTTTTSKTMKEGSSTEPPRTRIPETSSEFAEQNLKPLPFLSAPLGVTVRPSSKSLTWIEKRERQLDDTLRIQRRKAIVKEATRGYFHDVHAMRSHGGKTWIAPTTLIRQDRALYFPAIEGQRLSDRAKTNTADFLLGKVSIVSILTSQVSDKHAQSFYEPTFELYKNDDNFQLVQINLQDNFLKAALVSMFASSLRRTIPEQCQSTYLLSSHDLTMERDALALHNRHVGYTYLVGPDGKIRWAGCGFAEASEAQSLVACTGVLLNRTKEDKGGR